MATSPVGPRSWRSRLPFGKNSPSPAWIVRVGMALAGLLVALLADGTLRLLGAGAFFATFVDSLAAARARGPSRRLEVFATRGGVVFTVTAACAFLWPVPAGKMPVSGDHRVHLFRAWHLVTRRLAEWRLSGWSSDWFAGWPAGSDYPPGGDYWMALVRLLTQPILDWEQSYALGFTLAFVFMGLSAYLLARPFGVLAGMVAALLFIFDPGAFREGGFEFTVRLGVWPQQLSIAACVCALLGMLRYGATRETRWFVYSVLLMSVALLSHPFAVIVIASACPAFLTIHPEGRVRWGLRYFGALMAALGIASSFFIPFITRSEWFTNHGEEWASLPDVLGMLAAGVIFHPVAQAIVWLGLWGALVAMTKDRTSHATFLCVWGVTLILVGSSTVAQFVDPTGRVQWQRVVMVLKFIVYAFAGYTMQAIFSLLVREGGRRRRLVRAAIMAVLPFAAMPFYDSWKKWHAPGRVETARHANGEDLRALGKWVRSEQAKSDAFFRIAYVADLHDHGFAAAELTHGIPTYKIGYTPASVFLHRPGSDKPDYLRVLSVRFVVAAEDLSEPHLDLVRRFGALRVYRFRDYSPERFTLEGAGTATVERFDEEHVRLRLAGTDSTSVVSLHVAEFPAWRARLDGKAIRTHASVLAGKRERFLSASANGSVLEFDYGPGMPEYVGWACTLAAIVAMALIGAFRVEPPRLDRLLATCMALGLPLAVGYLALTKPHRVDYLTSGLSSVSHGP